MSKTIPAKGSHVTVWYGKRMSISGVVEGRSVKYLYIKDDAGVRGIYGIPIQDIKEITA